MDRYEVTKVLWDEVHQWATNHGYSFSSNSGQGKANNHPAQMMTWYDAVKWCNARSEKERKVPAYYTDDALSVPYRSGDLAPRVKWNAGYRLPTEAEWEKAARGGEGGHRFPWRESDNITHNQANYYSSSEYTYDVDPTRGYHATFNDGDYPYTSPVGYFSPNGYGLHDMAGNVREWCWDLLKSDYYASSPGVDPRGPDSGTYRVIRGGGWNATLGDAYHCRTSERIGPQPGSRGNDTGFRAVLPGN